VYIPAEVLEAAGFDPDATVWYSLRGYRRSKNGRTVIVSLYDAP